MNTVRARRTQNPDVFGHIPGIEIGTRWDSRQACSDSAVHPGIMAGIFGRKDVGAYSVALSGGYEDDVDNGYSFIYTGCGGRDTGGDKKLRTGPQAYDQTFEDNPRNMALKVSSMTKQPVRVVRGFKLHSDFAPAEGYRYDGLYVVDRAWREKGKAGFLVCKFEFRRLPDQPPIPRREGTLKLRLPKNRVPRHKAYSPIPEPKFEGIPVDRSHAGPSNSRSEEASTSVSKSTSANISSHRQPLNLVPVKPGSERRANGDSSTPGAGKNKHLVVRASQVRRLMKRRAPSPPMREPKFEGIPFTPPLQGQPATKRQRVEGEGPRSVPGGS